MKCCPDCTRADHPRVCGERLEYRETGYIATGSSPRMRGTLGAGRYPCPNDRIIPAYAGNAAQQQPFLSLMTDHPRVCGERPNVTNHIALSNGSSPRMRGTLVAKQVCANHSRIIPAYAGNAFLMSYVIAPFPDHPRVCGERQTTMRYAPTVIGSSPRMRGTRKPAQH